MTGQRTLAFAVLCAAAVSGGNGTAPSLASDVSPREAMRDFVIAIAEQARSAAPGFLIIPQNGLELPTIDGCPDSDLAAEYFAILDGVGQEDLSFGYTADDVPTPQEDHERLLALLDRVKNSGCAVLVVDYCRDSKHIRAARSIWAAHGFAGYAAPTRDLEVIAFDSMQPFEESADSVLALSSAGNVLFLLNPGRFADRRAGDGDRRHQLRRGRARRMV